MYADPRMREDDKINFKDGNSITRMNKEAHENKIVCEDVRGCYRNRAVVAR